MALPASGPRRVLVTGGTGVLGRYLVRCLAARGHDVVSLSRHAASSDGADESNSVRPALGDVLTGRGLEEAMSGCDTVVHAATSFRKMRETEVKGTENTLRAASAAGAHFVYVSIVGVDRNRYPYYKAKLAAEKVVESSMGKWTIQRGTQFHELLERFLSLPMMPVTKNLAFQALDAGDFSNRLADLVERGPSGRAQDFGGPRVVPVHELDAARRRVTGRKARLVPVPPLGFMADFERGTHLRPDQARGRRTWEEWLEALGASRS